MAMEQEQQCPECGCLFRIRVRNKKDRSTPQHRRFFGLITAAFKHWPDGSEFKPRDPEHLRAWLLCKVDYCDVAQTIRCETTNPTMLVSILKASFAAAKANAFVEADDNRVRVIVPRSVSFEKLSHLAACVVMDLVEQVIESETKLTAVQLLPVRLKVKKVRQPEHARQLEAA